MSHPTSLARAVGRAVELADVPTPGGGAVVAARDAAAAAAQLDALRLAAREVRPGLVWVLWDGHRPAAVHRAAARAGLVPVASYRYVGSWASPTHLVRVGRGQALRWFAASARPRWGRRSRLARLGNYLPRVGHRFFDGTAVLLRRVGRRRADVAGSELRGAPPCSSRSGGPATSVAAPPPDAWC